jgi:hypothetical protein
MNWVEIESGDMMSLRKFQLYQTQSILDYVVKFIQLSLVFQRSGNISKSRGTVVLQMQNKLARRMGGAQRYPSIARIVVMRFVRLNPSCELPLTPT